jgi:hypothetical protein
VHRQEVEEDRVARLQLEAADVEGVPADGPGYVAELSDSTLIRGRAVLFASGVEWRRLDVAGIDDLLGAGVYYEAGPSEALACTDSRVVVVGGGNSAGQAWSGSPGTRGRSRCWSAAAISARRCRSTSSISCRASRMLMCGCVRRW